MGYNNSLVVKDSYIDSIKNEILLKNSTLSFKSEKKFEEFKNSLNDSDNLDKIFKKSLEKEIPHVALDINISKTKFINEIANSEFFLNLATKYINAKKISISGQSTFQILSKQVNLKKKIMLNITITIMILKNFLKSLYI